MRSMRIAITADPYLPVPPKLYGGIERVVDFLARGLIERGHEVTLFAHPDSCTGGELVPYGSPPHMGFAHRSSELWQVGARLWQRRGEFDVIHSFGRLAAVLPVLPLRRLAKIQSYQRDRIPWRSVKIAVGLAGGSLRFTACSSAVFRDRSQHGAWGGRWDTIFNGVDVAVYDFVPRVSADAPLAFLGRLESIKGAHHAITIARAVGRRLVLAGNRPQTGPAVEYFDRQIAPHLGGRDIVYLGPVDDAQKNSLLGSVAALLMPVEWDEPFGIVMAEAFACGTPVIGLARGSVPEVVHDGVTGYVCQTVDEAVKAAARLEHIDRARVRAECEARFSSCVIVDAYERLYAGMVRE